MGRRSRARSGPGQQRPSSTPGHKIAIIARPHTRPLPRIRVADDEAHSDDPHDEPASAEELDADLEVADEAGASTELPAVVLGTRVGEPIEERQRVRPGRVRLSVILYPIYLLLVLSGGLAADVALDTEEWSFGVVALTWTLMYAWCWLYGVTWTYRRRWLRNLSALGGLGIQAGMAALCLDRAKPQLAATGGELAARPELTQLRWAAWMLLAGAALLLAHVVWFGRGWRVKKVEAPTRDEPEDEAASS